MPAPDDRTVLLFYREYEVDKWVPGDRYLKRVVRPLHARLTGRRHRVSGFRVAFDLLVEALRRRGCDVRVNDRRTARRHPEHPVGLFGYPSLLEGWDLPNPAVLGPGLYDHPSLAPDLMRDPRHRAYLVSCEWMRRMFARWYGEEACRVWFAGIDVARWPDVRGRAKDVDVLVYDKVYFDRDRREAELLGPVRERLAARGLRTHALRYGFYDRDEYREALARSRCMLFLSANETQGLACQEAMASGVPVLAWDQGFWDDGPRFEPEPVPASSVPYFAPECGERFRDLAGFDPALDRLLSGLDGYDPRGYVERELSLERSADAYLACYAQAAPSPVPA